MFEIHSRQLLFTHSVFPTFLRIQNLSSIEITNQMNNIVLTNSQYSRHTLSYTHTHRCIYFLSTDAAYVPSYSHTITYTHTRFGITITFIVFYHTSQNIYPHNQHVWSQGPPCFISSIFFFWFPKVEECMLDFEKAFFTFLSTKLLNLLVIHTSFLIIFFSVNSKYIYLEIYW